MTEKLANILTLDQYQDLIHQERWVDLLKEVNQFDEYFELVKLFEDLGILRTIELDPQFWSIEESLAYQTIPSRTIVVPDGVTFIRVGTFFDSSFKCVRLPEGLTHIYGEAFKQTKLSQPLVLPKSIQQIGISSFDDFSAPKIIYEGSTAEWNQVVGGAHRISMPVECNNGTVARTPARSYSLV